MFKVLALQISENIDIKLFKSICTAELVSSDSDELFYKAGTDKYIYVFRYGVACFLNHTDIELQNFLKLIFPSCKNPVEPPLNEIFDIEITTSENKFEHNKIAITNPTAEALRIIMLNVSESVALDYFSQQSTVLLEATNKQTLLLENTGKLEISGKNLKKFIGKTINLKNRITENLYIFDSPPETWDDEYLYKLDAELKKIFDIQSRYRNIHEELQIIKENLGLFIDIMHHRKSSLLEGVVILLILVEVINMIIEKLF